MPNPLRAVTWQSQDFIEEARAAGYLEKRGAGHFLTRRAVHLWFVVNPKVVDLDADLRRDLVPYDEVLREMGPEIANTKARPPIEHRRRVDAAVQRLLDSVGYVPDTGRPA